jgi:hypothetical protein
MAYFLVTATPISEKENELKRRLDKDEFEAFDSYGLAISYSLRHMRKDRQGRYHWEEEDFSEPPLSEERAAVLDHYFTGIETEPVQKGKGWAKIVHMPFVFPDLALKG